MSKFNDDEPYEGEPDFYESVIGTDGAQDDEEDVDEDD